MTASTGIITTIVGSSSIGHSGDGGDATSASLRLPRGVTLDSAGISSLIQSLLLRGSRLIYISLSRKLVHRGYFEPTHP